MAKEIKSPGGPEKYGEVVHRLEDVVKRLEGGDLSLEDSLKAFEEGIKLVRRGEQLLADAEKRIEQLLVEDGEEKVAPLELAANGAQAQARPGSRSGPVRAAPPPERAPPEQDQGEDDDEDDVPF